MEQHPVAPASYQKLTRPDPKSIPVVHEVDAVIRLRCPMQGKWISMRGKRNSCTWCPHIKKIRYTEWGAKVECGWTEGMSLHDFPMVQPDIDEEPK